MTTSTSTSTSEASRYQQLRDHLNYLRLPDAAAALPTVLDQAKTEKLSPTATLERLIRIEVAATEARRLTTHPLERVETTAHAGHRPTHAGAVNTRTPRDPSAPMPTRSTSISVNPRSSELQSDMLAPLVWCA